MEKCSLYFWHSLHFDRRQCRRVARCMWALFSCQGNKKQEWCFLCKKTLLHYRHGLTKRVGRALHPRYFKASRQPTHSKHFNFFELQLFETNCEIEAKTVFRARMGGGGHLGRQPTHSKHFNFLNFSFLKQKKGSNMALGTAEGLEALDSHRVTNTFAL